MEWNRIDVRQIAIDYAFYLFIYHRAEQDKTRQGRVGQNRAGQGLFLPSEHPTVEQIGLWTQMPGIRIPPVRRKHKIFRNKAVN